MSEVRAAKSFVIMQVTPHDIGTFLVESRSKPDGVEAWLVDLAWMDDGWRKTRIVCGCPDCFGKHYKTCAHILATLDYLKDVK